MLTRSRTLRTHRLSPLALALLLPLGAAPALAQDDAVAPAPRFVEGEQWTYDLNLNLVVSQDASTTQIVQGATLDLFVSEVAEDGRARIEVSVLALTTVWSDEAGQLEYTWNAESGEEPTDVSSPDESFTAMAHAIANANIVLAVSPSGEALEVIGLSDAFQAVSEDERFGPRALGVFAPPQLASTLQPIFRGDGLVDAERAQGDGWQTSEALAMGPAGRITFSADLVVRSIEDGVIAYSGDEFIELERPANPDETTPVLDVVEQEGSIQGAWSLDANVLNTRKATRRLATRWTLASLALEQTQNSTITLERRTE